MRDNLGLNVVTGPRLRAQARLSEKRCGNEAESRSRLDSPGGSSPPPSGYLAHITTSQRIYVPGVLSSSESSRSASVRFGPRRAASFRRAFLEAFVDFIGKVMMIVCDAAGAMQPRDDGCRGGEVTGEEARTALISCHAQGSCSDAPLRAGPRAGHSSRAFWRGPVGGVSHVTVPPSSPGARLRGFNFLLPPGGASANLLRWTLRRHGEWGMGLAAQRKASLARNVASPRTAVAGGGGTRATVPPPHLKVPPVEAQRPWGPPPRRFSTGPGAGPGIRGGSGRRGASRPGHRAGALPRGTPHPRRDGARAPVPGTPPGTLRLGRRAPPLGTARPAGMPRPSRGCRGAPRPAPRRRD